MKKNPLAAEISLIGDKDNPGFFLGRVDFRVLHEDTGLIAGALIGGDGQRIGKVEIDGFPLSSIHQPRRQGRPRSDEKKMAVTLAWALKCNELAGKRTEADNQTASLFDYSEGKKVRDIRTEVAKANGVDFDRDVLFLTDSTINDDLVCSMLVESLVISESPPGQLEIQARRVTVWAEGFGAKVRWADWLRITAASFEKKEGFDCFATGSGPKIISIIRPGL